MVELKVMSLNGQDMIDLIPKNLKVPGKNSCHYWRAEILAAVIKKVDPDIIGLVEAPPHPPRTDVFVNQFLGGGYSIHQGDKRGALGMAFLVRNSIDMEVNMRSKEQSQKDFKLDKYDANNDGITEIYKWWNRVPLEAAFSGGGLKAETTFILIHAKSKGAFIPGDLFAYEKISHANRMKQRAQADAIRRRLDQLIDDEGKGRVIVMGDMNDGPEFDKYAAMLGGGFLEPVMGSIWHPNKIMYNPHYPLDKKDRWTIDFLDRVVNPLGTSRYGMPSEMRSWIDHILVSPELKECIVKDSTGILHEQPRVPELPKELRGMKGTDHHPPYVTLDL
ncbi:MAG: hypothetical protein A7315_06545 [Candidatus Altiarchaeales archaeon WOR_SM1_79]|nr:MAG: hypothetical protein A7315_06545 [Candidatus Altiarchaeales archaeon WOR_SM1_79]